MPSRAHCDDALALVVAASAAHRHGLYLGGGSLGPVFAPPEYGLLALGPPRSGKTTSVVIPNVVKSAGSVLAVSTKRDVLDATAVARGRLGERYLFDPSGAIEPPHGVKRISWSPLSTAGNWDQAVLTADAMVGAVRHGERGDSSHWSERASALLASLFHGASLDGACMADLVAAVNRHEPQRFLAALSRNDANLALDLLVGITVTEDREQSGIWSTASGVLAAYRTEAALASSLGESFDAARFCRERSTLYVAASGEHQRHVAPLVAGIVRDVRSAAFSIHAALRRQTSGVNDAPVLLVLDELANIAPLHDLPSLVAEGASQGILTLACLQDLSQGRARFGTAAEGFLSLFGAKLVLPGIGDIRTLEALSKLAGEHEEPVISVTSNRARPFQRRASRTVSTRRVARLSVESIANPKEGTALAVIGARPQQIALTPHHRASPWREAVLPLPSNHLLQSRQISNVERRSLRGR